MCHQARPPLGKLKGAAGTMKRTRGRTIERANGTRSSPCAPKPCSKTTTVPPCSSARMGVTNATSSPTGSGGAAGELVFEEPEAAAPVLERQLTSRQSATKARLCRGKNKKPH